MQTAPTEANQLAAGLDSDTDHPAWRPPADRSRSEATGRKPIRVLLLYGSILLVVVLVVVAIWGFGGFKRRTDILKTTSPGTLFTVDARS